jgi:outer membrane protein, heavy metal efflux system
MRHVVYVCVGVCALLSGAVPVFAQGAAAVAADRLTEAEAVARLVASDPRMRALRARVDEVAAQQRDRSRWPNPSVSYSREHVAETTDLFVVARQELPVSGRLTRLAAAGRLALDGAEADARFQTLDLQIEVRHAFASLLLSQERDAALAQGVDRLRALVDVLRVREQAGEGSTYDRLRGERALLDLEADRTAASADVARARGRLAAYLGPGVRQQALVADGRLMPGPSSAPVATLVEQALATRADYQAALTAARRYQAERDAARRLRMPAPTIGAGLKRSGPAGRADAGFLVSVDLAVPLFNRGQSMVALATAEGARAEAEAASLRLRIDADVEAAHAALAIHRDRTTRYEQGAASTADRLADIGRIAYEEGELGILDLLDASRQALDARLRVLDLSAAARHAAIELDRATGSEMRP